jgi:copper(I)-binding protein
VDDVFFVGDIVNRTDQELERLNPPMKKVFWLIPLGVLLLTTCGSEKGIEIHDALMRPAAQGENGAVYFVIHNHSSQADALTGLTSDIAVAEMHESKMNGDIMQMNQVESVPLEPYAEIEFAPGGLHVMLVGLKQDMKLGDEIDLSLHFKNYQDLKVRVTVSESAVPGDQPSEDH